MKYKKNIPKILADLLIILIPLALCAGYMLWVHFTHQAGGYVYIEQDGAKTVSYPLSEDREIELKAENGGYNLLVIKEGKVYIRSASCPDKICVNHRKIGFEGERIVCLPNRLTVRITKEGKAPDLTP
ncbi:MAG: NusG domain II-containing protein [Clostridia bacterium]|nr:NusG domain II-containing protein [Clostridia bacterium]